VIDARPEVGIYLNVSFAALSDETMGLPPSVAQALHVFFTQGILVHPQSGTVALLDDRIRHAVYVELPALPTWPVPGQPLHVYQHPFLINGLPALNVGRTAEFAVSNKTVREAPGRRGSGL
jgi:hypothetical protein